MSTVIISGPQACGKTVYSEFLAKFYSCDRVVDYEGNTPWSELEGALVLTNLPVRGSIPFSKAMYAMLEAGVKLPPWPGRPENCPDALKGVVSHGG